MLTAGRYIWTACSASWLVIAFLTSLPEAYLTALGCGVCAIIWPKKI